MGDAELQEMRGLAQRWAWQQNAREYSRAAAGYLLRGEPPPSDELVEKLDSFESDPNKVVKPLTAPERERLFALVRRRMEREVALRGARRCGCGAQAVCRGSARWDDEDDDRSDGRCDDCCDHCPDTVGCVFLGRPDNREALAHAVAQDLGLTVEQARALREAAGWPQTGGPS